MKAANLPLPVLALFLVSLLFSPGCRQRDIRVTTVEVPNVYNEACQKIVKNALSAIEGIDVAKITFADGKMTVVYDSMKLGIKNIEHAVKDAGFDANDFKAESAARAKLPPQCLAPDGK